jgi:hypothetical protein
MKEAEAVMKDMVDYIELTDNVIRDLSSRPVMQKAAIDRTSAALIASGLVTKEASAVLAESLEKDPNRALELIEKMAAMVNINGAGGFSIGSPAGVKKKASIRSEADQAFMRRLGLS